MDLFPFISRRSHAAIVQAKDDQIALLRETLAHAHSAEERERERRDGLTEKLVDAVRQTMTPTPAPEPRRRREQPDTPDPEPETLDLSMVDPNDNEALALIARREMVPMGSRVNGVQLMKTIENLRQKVIEAHDARLRTHSGPVYVPATLKERIAQAEQAGAVAAAQEVGV